jgi:hypothetical protein
MHSSWKPRGFGPRVFGQILLSWCASINSSFIQSRGWQKVTRQVHQSQQPSARTSLWYLISLRIVTFKIVCAIPGPSASHRLHFDRRAKLTLWQFGHSQSEPTNFVSPMFILTSKSFNSNYKELWDFQNCLSCWQNFASWLDLQPCLQPAKGAELYGPLNSSTDI